jgi:hypothetical protein
VTDSKSNAVVGYVAERYLPFVLFNLNEEQTMPSPEEPVVVAPTSELTMESMPDYLRKGKNFQGAKLTGTGKG